MVHSDESSDDERGRDGGSSNSETDDDYKSSDEGDSADKVEEIDLSMPLSAPSTNLGR